MIANNLIEKVSEVLQIPNKEAIVIVEGILDSIVHALGRGEKVEIRGFGTFRTRQKRPHRSQSKERSTSRSSSEDDSLLQAEQGTSGTRLEDGVGRHLNCTSEAESLSPFVVTRTTQSR
jgi:nucleoid DNA-binding protein